MAVRAIVVVRRIDVAIVVEVQVVRVVAVVTDIVETAIVVVAITRSRRLKQPL